MTDHTLDTLLEMDEDLYEVGGGYWVKIDAKRVARDDKRPHGIKYSLTFHDPDGERLIGYDNAHAVEVGFGMAKRYAETSDHLHDGDDVALYEYRDAAALLEDFWADVERVLKERGVA